MRKFRKREITPSSKRRENEERRREVNASSKVKLPSFDEREREKLSQRKGII